MNKQPLSKLRDHRYNEYLNKQPLSKLRDHRYNEYLNKQPLSKLRDHRYNEYLNKGYHNRQIVIPIFEKHKIEVYFIFI